MGDGWLWIERLSWLVSIVGIPSLVFGLLTLIRRPSIDVGFFPLNRGRRFFRMVKQPSNEIHMPNPNSNPLTLRLVVANVGRTTARELLVNFSFPTLSVTQVSVPSGAPPVVLHPGSRYPLWAYHIDHIHPGVHHFSEVHLLAIRSPSTIPVEYEVTMADANATRGECRVVVS